jgi:hypothetical protein
MIFLVSIPFSLTKLICFRFMNRFSKNAIHLIKMGVPLNFLWLLSSVSVPMLRTRKIKTRYLSVHAYYTC